MYGFEYIPLLYLPCIELIEHLVENKCVEIQCVIYPDVTPKMDSPLNWRVSKTTIWYKAWANRFLHMTLVMRGFVLPTGGLSINPLVGFSVARAKAPNVSMIKFIHNNCTAMSGTSLADTTATKLIASAATFTVNYWNWMNFWMLL